MSEKISAKDSIMEFCIECYGGERQEARRCVSKNCPLFKISRLYFGVEERENKRVLSPEHLAKLQASRNKSE